MVTMVEVGLESNEQLRALASEESLAAKDLSPRKRVLMVTFPFPPLAASGTFRSVRFTRYLPECGWEPTILTLRQEAMGQSHSLDPSLYRLIDSHANVVRTGMWQPRAKLWGLVTTLKSLLEPTSSKERTKDSTSDDLQQCKTGSRSKNIFKSIKKWKQSIDNSLRLMPDGESGWFFPALRSGLRLMKQQQYDAIYCTAPPHSALLIATALSKLTAKPLILDFRDPWARKSWQDGRPRRIDQRLEQWCVNSASRVVLNTEAACQEFRKYYSDQPNETFLAIPNGTDPSFWETLAPGQSAKFAQISGQGFSPPLFCHPGEIYGKRSLLPFIRALEILHRQGQPIALQQIGNVANTTDVIAETARLGLEDSVVLLGQQPHQVLIEHMHRASFFLIIQPQTGTQIPAKIFEMLNFRKPLLALTGEGATADLVRKFHLGIVETSIDPARIAAAACRLLQGAEEFSQGDGWDRALSKFDGRKLTRVLAETLDSVVPKKSEKRA